MHYFLQSALTLTSIDLNTIDTSFLIFFPSSNVIFSRQAQTTFGNQLIHKTTSSLAFIRALCQLNDTLNSAGSRFVKYNCKKINVKHFL